MSDVPAPAADPKPTGFTARYKQLIAEYGFVAIGVYLTTSLIAFLFAIGAIKLGFDVGTTAGTSGAIAFAGWGFVKLTQVPRILITLVLTPLVARWLGRTPKTPEEPSCPSSSSPPSESPPPGTSPS